MTTTLTHTVDDAQHLSRVRCPVDNCHVYKRFAETEQTLTDHEMAQARRLEYLRLRHEAGAHYLRKEGE